MKQFFEQHLLQTIKESHQLVEGAARDIAMGLASTKPEVVAISEQISDGLYEHADSSVRLAFNKMPAQSQRALVEAIATQYIAEIRLPPLVKKIGMILAAGAGGAAIAHAAGNMDSHGGDGDLNTSAFDSEGNVQQVRGARERNWREPGSWGRKEPEAFEN